MLPNTTVSSQKANKRFATVNPKLEKQLSAYAAAVGASAVAVLAAAPPASAEIVYTPANVELGNSYAIDLNGDGISDFTLIRCECAGSHTQFVLLDFDVPGNAVRPPVGADRGAAALPVGAMIGNGQAFTTATSYGGAEMVFGFAYGSISHQGGPWVNATNRYLGLKFMVDGKVHYGWARLTIGSFDFAHRDVTLTGYAYETVPGRMLHAGQKSETDAETASSATDAPAQPTTLALLALGADGLSASRN
jgi:hypothetical protein